MVTDYRHGKSLKINVGNPAIKSNVDVAIIHEEERE